jgi:hypothetical protein
MDILQSEFGYGYERVRSYPPQRQVERRVPAGERRAVGLQWTGPPGPGWDPGSSRPGRPIWLGWTSVDGPIGAERHVLGPVTLSVCVCVTSAADAEWTCRLLGPSAIVHEPTAFRSPLRPTRPDQEWHGPPSALASDSDPRWSVAGAIKLC